VENSQSLFELEKRHKAQRTMAITLMGNDRVQTKNITDFFNNLRTRGITDK